MIFGSGYLGAAELGQQEIAVRGSGVGWSPLLAESFIEQGGAV